MNENWKQTLAAEYIRFPGSTNHIKIMSPKSIKQQPTRYVVHNQTVPGVWYIIKQYRVCGA